MADFIVDEEVVHRERDSLRYIVVNINACKFTKNSTICLMP